MKAEFWLGIMVLMQISRLRFKQSKTDLYAHPTYLCFGPFCKLFWRFLGVFGDK